VAVKGNTHAVNERRNSAKIAALKEAAARSRTVCLMAETGHSFLSTRRPFFNYVRAVAQHGSFKVVLCNRSFVEAHGISAAYQSSTTTNELGLHPDFLGKFRESTDWIHDSRSDPEIRISQYGLPATVLLTDTVAFFEPYFRADRTQRLMKLFDTFELEITDPDGLQLMRDNFDFYWAHSLPLPRFLECEPDFKGLLKRWVDLIR
jgi:hypothetical protein